MTEPIADGGRPADASLLDQARWLIWAKLYDAALEGLRELQPGETPCAAA